MTTPGYQTLLNRDIPVVELPDGAGKLRVIAGEYGGARGLARTYSAMDVWDLRLGQNKTARFDLAAGRTLALVVLRGTVQINGDQIARETQWVQLSPEGTGLEIAANSDAMVLLLSGEPLNEPVIGYGPFVMNSEKEISEAIDDFNSGRFARMTPTAA